MVIVTMELRTASTFHVEDGILTEDEVLHNSLNIRLSELFDSDIHPLLLPKTINYQVWLIEQSKYIKS